MWGYGVDASPWVTAQAPDFQTPWLGYGRVHSSGALAETNFAASSFTGVAEHVLGAHHHVKEKSWCCSPWETYWPVLGMTHPCPLSRLPFLPNFTYQHQ